MKCGRKSSCVDRLVCCNNEGKLIDSINVSVEEEHLTSPVSFVSLATMTTYECLAPAAILHSSHGR